MFSNKVRSIISSFGIFLGAASLLVNVTFLRGMDANVKYNMDKIGGLSILTIRNREAKNEQEMLAFHRSPGLTMRQMVRLRDSIDGVEYLLPEGDLHWEHIAGGGKRTGAIILAVGPHHLETYNYAIAAGTGMTRKHHSRAERVCLAGPRVARRLFGDPRTALGKKIRNRGVSYEVVGILETGERFDRRSRELLIPYSTYQALFAGRSRSIEEMALKVRDVEKIAGIKQRIETALLGMHRGARDFDVEASIDKIKEMEAAAMGIQVVVIAIAAISLTVGGISIMNIMFGTIGDRIREIGIRKALGARRVDLFSQFVMEAVLLSLVGGIPGIALGAAITLLPEGTFPFTPQLVAGDYVLAALFVVVAGLGSGVFPAMKAAGMEPVEALRY
jgi:ABC-type antimicrobial peptide transport system permease subunit